jgi:hypothetical protein
LAGPISGKPDIQREIGASRSQWRREDYESDGAIKWLGRLGMSRTSISSPGFTIQEDDETPVLTIIFEDLKTAEQCASSMREIIAKATEIIGRD